MRVQGSHWRGSAALLLTAALIMSVISLTLPTPAGVALERSTSDEPLQSEVTELDGSEVPTDEAREDLEPDLTEKERAAAEQAAEAEAVEQTEGETGDPAPEEGETEEPPVDEPAPTELPDTDPPETSPPDGDSEHVEDQEQPEETDPQKPDDKVPPQPQDKDPPKPGTKDPAPKATPTPTPPQKPSTPPPRPTAPPPYIPNPWAPPGDHNGSTSGSNAPGSYGPIGLQGVPAPAGGLIGDDYPMKYKMLPAFPIVWDEWNFAHRQCTSFVAWRLQQVNQVPFSNHALGVARWGNAGQWGDSARSAGIRVDMNPAPGAVAYNAPGHGGAGSAGHVAWVADVLDDGRIVIEEYNWGFPPGHYGARTVSKEAFSGYIHIRDLAAPAKPTPVQTAVSMWFEDAHSSADNVTWNDPNRAACRVYLLNIQICRNPALIARLIVPAQYMLPADLPMLFREAPVIAVIPAAVNASLSAPKKWGTP